MEKYFVVLLEILLFIEMGRFYYLYIVRVWDKLGIEAKFMELLTGY